MGRPYIMQVSSDKHSGASKIFKSDHRPLSAFRAMHRPIRRYDTPPSSRPRLPSDIADRSRVRPLAILAIVLIPSLNERQALSFARGLQSAKENSLMNFTVIKQMRYREDRICMTHHYLVEEWPFGDS